jgi:flagellar biosynthesis/type III secretory pathway protein FliH
MEEQKTEKTIERAIHESLQRLVSEFLLEGATYNEIFAALTEFEMHFFSFLSQTVEGNFRQVKKQVISVLEQSFERTILSLERTQQKKLSYDSSEGDVKESGSP